MFSEWTEFDLILNSKDALQFSTSAFPVHGKKCKKNIVFFA